MQIYIFFCSIILTCLYTAGLALYAFQQRKVPGVRFFAWMVLCESLLALSEILSMVSPEQKTALFWFNFRSMIETIIPIFWVLFANEYFGKKPWITKRLILFSLIIPFLSMIFLWMDPFSNIWTIKNVDFTQVNSLWLANTSTRIPGVWFYIHSFYSIALYIGGVVLIIAGAWKNRRIYRYQSILITIGAMISVITSIIPIFNFFEKIKFNPFMPGIGISAIFFALAIFTFGFLNNSPSSNSDPDFHSTEFKERSNPNLLILFFIIIAGIIATLGFLSFTNFERQYRTQVENQLTSISLLKVEELQQWRNDRLSDAGFFFHNDSFSQLVEEVQQNPSIDNRLELQSWLNSIKAYKEYNQVSVVDSLGNIMLTGSNIQDGIPQIVKENIPSVLADNKINFLDFYKDPPNNQIHLTLMVPIYSKSDNHPLAIVLIEIDPRVYLYPLILRWPVPSDTAETSIIRREGDKVLYLSELRFQSNSALNQMIDMSDTERPSVKAVTGSIGIVEGINYRGHDVIADVRPISDTPWFLVSRIDKAEIDAPLVERGRLSLIFFGSLVLGSGIGVAFIWRQQKIRALIATNKLQVEIAERDRKLKEAQVLAHLGFWYWDIKTGNVEWSEEVYKIFQLDSSSFKPHVDSILALSPWPDDQKRDQELIDRSIKTHQPGMYEQKFLHPDNSVGYYSSTFQGLFDNNNELFAIVGSVIDITDRTIQVQALRESEKRSRALFEHAAIGVLIIDPISGKFLDVNQKFCELLGFSKEEILQKTFSDVTPPEFIKKSKKYNDALLAGKIKEYSFEKQYLRKNGTRIWASLTVSPLWDPNDKPTNPMHIAAVHDITERKKIELALRESEKRFRETIANLDEGFYSASVEGVLLGHNQAYNRILGFPEKQDLRGLNVPDFWQNREDRKQYLEILMSKGSINSYQIKAKKTTGEKLTLLTSAHIIRNEAKIPIKVDGVILDITARNEQEEKILATQAELQKLLEQAEQSRRALLTIIEDQKIAQEEVKQLNKTLEQRVVERTAQLKTSNEELESFAYSISHDLRAPLRAIDGYSRILEQDYATTLDQEGLRLLQIVRKSTRNLDILITDLLSLSRVGRSELKFELINMNTLVDSVLKELVTPEIQEKFSIIVQDLPKSFGDPTLMRHVWINLISNAIKYSMPKEKPEIVISGLRSKGKYIYTIKDNGVGFNPNYKEKLFGLFQRLHKASEFEGTGVGLAIVQRIIHRHDGEVWGDSQLGLGAVFSFTLPKRKEAYE